MEHHTINPYPDPQDESPLYINEPWLIDESLRESVVPMEPDDQEDNIRIYIPMDLNKSAILRRLDYIIAKYDEANEDNESDFYVDVYTVISQIEIYDQIWYVRHMPAEGNHSNEAVSLVKDVIGRLENISDGGAETFPFDVITELKQEYGLD